MKRLTPKPAFLLGALIFIVIAVIAFSAPILPIPDPDKPDLLALSIPPVWVDGGTQAHILGTDSLGRDVLSRLIHGARSSLLIGFAVTAVAALIGISLGLIGGYFSGKTESVVSFLITARLSMPIILVCLSAVAVFRASFVVVTVVLGALLWDRFALVTKSMTQMVRKLDYVTAAHLQGASTLRIMLTEILPSIRNELLIVATLEIGLAIVLESALSFLGMGVPPPTASWGLMIAEGKSELLFNPWLTLIPSVALFLLILSINLMGDALQGGPAGGGTAP